MYFFSNQSDPSLLHNWLKSRFNLQGTVTNQGGNTKQMFLGYQNMHLLIKNMCKQKNRVGITGNTRKSTFRISEHVLTNQKTLVNERLRWEYLGIPNKCLYGIRICTYSSKTCVK